MRYDAFISYSQAADSPLASALQAGLHAFAKPWYRRRAANVFLDKSKLAAAHSLKGVLIPSLEASGHYLLLASPLSARSEWVQAELSYWLANKPHDRILIVLTDGDIVWNRPGNDFDWTATTALPRLAARAFPDEPFYIDLRWAKAHADLTILDPRFHDAVARISATIRGVSLDEIAGEEVRQHRRTRRIVAAVMTLLIVLAGGVAAASMLALRSGWEAQRNLASALQLTKTIASDVIAGMKDLKGVETKRIQAITNRAIGQVAVLDTHATSGTANQIREVKAALDLELAELTWRLGQGPQSIESARRAQSTIAELRAADPGNSAWIALLVRCQRLIGEFQIDTENGARAEATFREALQVVEHSATKTEPGAALDISRIYRGLGKIFMDSSKLAPALDSFRKALRVADEDIAVADRDSEWHTQVSSVLDLIGVVSLLQLRPDQSIEAYRRSQTLIETMRASDTGNVQLLARLAQIHYRLGVAYRYLNQPKPAMEAHRQGLAITEELIASDRGNVGYLIRKAAILDGLGDIAKDVGDWPQALNSYQDAARLRKAMTANNPTDDNWQNFVAVSDNNLGETELGAGHASAALAHFRQSLDLLQAVATRDSTSTAVRQNQATAHRGIGHALLALADREGAVSHLRLARALLAGLSAESPDNKILSRDLEPLDVELARMAER